MQHETDLIGTIAMGLSAAFVIGLIISRLHIPPVVGYLIAGVIVGPFTPGFVADSSTANQLAELGVLLLMFGVGLHFSISDLVAVRHVAVPGALLKIVVVTALGTMAGLAWGWSMGAGIVFGMGLAVASTVVLLRALMDLGSLKQTPSKIAIGSLIVEDLITVLALVLLPVLADSMGGVSPSASNRGVFETILIALCKIAVFLFVMLVVGRRVLPWIFKRVAGVDSRELFLLAVLALALGVAYGAAQIFDVSFALGAFVAGVILSETAFGHQAEEEIYTFREAFGILFFVSVGMLIDPSFLIENPVHILVTVLIIVVGKGVAGFLITLILRESVETALTVAVGLGQIGEFSFILATMGLGLKILPKEGSDLMLAAALVSIIINTILFHYLPQAKIWAAKRWPSRSSAVLDARANVPAVS